MNTYAICNSPLLSNGASQLRSLIELPPKSSLLCVNRSHIRCGPRAGKKAIRYSVNIALNSELIGRPLVNAFVPEPLVTARADPHPFYRLWRHQFWLSRITLSANLCWVKRSFKPAQFSQGRQRKRQKTMWHWPENFHENLVPLPTYLYFHLILRS